MATTVTSRLKAMQEEAAATRRRFGAKEGTVKTDEHTYVDANGRKVRILPGGELADAETGEILIGNNPEETDAAAVANQAATTDPDLFEALNRAADMKNWIPKQAGDRIQGTIVATYNVPPEMDELKGLGWPVYEVQISTGDVFRVQAMPTVLRNQCLRYRPRVGDRIGIVFKGMVESPTKGRQDYGDYSVVVQHIDSDLRASHRGQEELPNA